MADDIFEICCPKTVTTELISINACTNCYCVRTADGKEIRSLLVHCRHYPWVVFSREKIRAEIFEKTFSSNVLPREAFHMIMLTVGAIRLP